MSAQSAPWLYGLVSRVRDRPVATDLLCTDCGLKTWANLYGYFGCVNPACRRFGQMVPVPLEEAA